MMSKNLSESHLNRANYELFIVMLTFLSLFNLIVYFLVNDNNIEQLALLMNTILSMIFLLDFLARLRTAPGKKQYFIKEFGWMELVGSIPIPGFILLRIKHVVQVIRGVSRVGGREILRQIVANRADTAILSITLFVLYILELGSIFILLAEAGVPGSEITNANDAMWWVLVTISTVGYGDLVPITPEGRQVAFFVIIAGVGVFGTLSGFLAKLFLGDTEKASAKQAADATNQLLAEIAKLREILEAAHQERKEIDAGFLTRLDSLEKRIDERL